MSKMNGTYDVGGHTLTFNVNTFCDLEEAFGVDDVNAVLAIIQGLEKAPSLKVIRTMFHAAFLQEHPEMTVAQAGQIISDVGINAASEALSEAVAQAFPADDGEVGNVKAAKRKAGK